MDVFTATHAQRLELKTRIQGLVDTNFQGDYGKAFEFYANGRYANVLTIHGVLDVLRDAGVGNAMTRGRWAQGIIDELDTDGDRRISSAEFQSILS